MVRHSPNRRGVVILIVLSLLVLFVLLVVTFAIVTGQYRRAAVAVARQEWLGEDPQKAADRVMYALVREPNLNQTGSPFRGHSLLTDVYGVSYRGKVFGGSVPLAGGVQSGDQRPQIWQFNFTPQPPWTPSTLNGFYNGSVLTLIDRVRFTPPQWAPSTLYSLYAIVEPRVSNGFWYQAVDAGTSDDTTEPIWPTTLGDTVNDGGVTWRCIKPTSGLQNIVSTRVVGYWYTPPNTYTLRIINPQYDDDSIVGPQHDATFVLNGKPFVGTGFGYNPASGPNVPRLYNDALKPNRKGDTSATLLTWLAGGANESYDAADYQNLILAAVAYDPDRSSMRVLPSFHREELVSYWMALDANDSDTSGWNKLGGDTDTRYTDDPAISLTASPNNIYSNLEAPNFDVRHKLLFRPMPWDHPTFTGSNVAFDAGSRTAKQIDEALTTGRAGFDLDGDGNYDRFEVAWDVDNDGDGIKDSIWIDPDLPIQTTEDGRTFRPLVAIHCIDMDGRLNLNAHGNYAHIPGLLPVPVPVPLASGATSAAFPKGQGYGPPEVDLNALINNDAVNGPYHRLLRERYGADGLPGRGGYDRLMQFKFYEYPGNYFASFFARSTHFNRSPTPVTPFEALSGFGSNMDLRGLFACGVDHRGQPLYEGIYTPGSSPSGFVDQLTDSPYEFNLNNPSGADAPFTVAELEKVLRYRDFDASTLQSRLTDLNNLDFLKDLPVGPVLGSLNRRAVTTDSYDIPVPGVVSPDDWTGTPPQTIMEILAARLDGTLNLSDEIEKMLAPDLMMGLRMDINRPLGNGRDDNGNGVVDEAHPSADPALNESLGPEYALNGANLTNPPMAIDHDNDGTISGDSDAYLARHYLARHLYVLLMLLKEKGSLDFDGDASNNVEETGRVLAQWAINAVDFRDADSIMTPFEYDVNPFNGWDVDGILGSADDNHPDRRVVWGCERPELLITETLAFHDVRTEDLKDPGGTKAEGDPDYDQRLMPRGALFVELYNPWAGHDKWPGEFYGKAKAPSGVWGVELNRRNTADHPIWRLAITDRAEPDALDMANPERAVYFADPGDLIATGGAKLGTQMHYSTVGGIAPLPPGRYAVVGSAGSWSAGAPPSSPYATTIGRRSDATEGGGLNSDKTRQIVLRPNVDPDVNQVEVRNNTNPPVDPAADPITVDPPMDDFSTPPAKVQPAIAVPVDAVLAPAGFVKTRTKVRATPPPSTPAGYEVADMSLSISEPLGGYDDAAGFDPTLADGEGAFTVPIDTPVDGRLPAPNTTIGPEDGSYPGYVHLQRLANPLAPYDDNLNPYLTIDVMPVDLTVFNGVTATDGGRRFGCFERGADDRVDREFWHQPPSTVPSPEEPPDEPSAVHVFGYVLHHTLGTLNRTYEPAFGIAGAPIPDIRPWLTSSPSRFYVGAPDTISTGKSPFPWLPWNNRPYVSPTELLLVPRSSSSRLLRDFSTCSTTPGPASAHDNPLGRFHHLLNFFHQSDPNVTPSGPTTPHAGNLYRVFEYLRVQPKFAGTETLLNPSYFGLADAYSDPVPGPPGTELLHPPFNQVSAYREPGRINLNTIYDERVWNAIWGSHGRPVVRPEVGPEHPMTFNDFIDDRRGYGPVSGNIFEPMPPRWKPSTPYSRGDYCQPTASNGFCYRAVDVVSPGVSGANEPDEPDPWPTTVGATIPDGDVTWECRALIPTFFANPYRASGTSWLVPPDASSGSGLGRLEVDNTMLRTNRNVMGVTPPATGDVPRFLNRFDDLPRDTDRNPYFSYQALQRLSNLVTCRSNVYALWLTIGYFEVEWKPHPVTGQWQWELGQEVGIDTGTVKRHRAFYIIDRSIPVAFEPGQNHNVDKCVLLRRFIE